MTRVANSQRSISRRGETRTLKRQRRFHKLWSSLDEPIDEVLASAKDEVFIDFPDEIVEIGPGHGSSFHRYPAGTKVVAFEPNQFMHDNLREAAEANHLELDLRSSSAVDMDVPTGSAEVVVSSLVLCSVDDPTAALQEIRRVLVPGGRLVFVEHIAAGKGTPRRLAQRLLRRPWKAMADQCDLLADTHNLIGSAGFKHVATNTEILGSTLDPSSLTIYGVAIR